MKLPQVRKLCGLLLLILLAAGCVPAPTPAPTAVASTPAVKAKTPVPTKAAHAVTKVAVGVSSSSIDELRTYLKANNFTLEEGDGVWLDTKDILSRDVAIPELGATATAKISLSGKEKKGDVIMMFIQIDEGTKPGQWGAIPLFYVESVKDDAFLLRSITVKGTNPNTTLPLTTNPFK